MAMHPAPLAAPPAPAIPVPPVPASLAATGLSAGFLVQLLVKTVYRGGFERPSDMARAMCLPPWVIEDVVALARERKLLENLGQMGAKMSAEMRYALTAKGREWALEALAQSEWTGPAPVPLAQFAEQVMRQSIRRERLSPEMLAAVFQNLTLAPELMDDIGPAVNSGASILLYGPPGNGKSSIAEAICAAYRDHIHLPHAIEVGGAVITLYDSAVHARVGEAGAEDGIRRGSGCDARYVPCRRPTVVVGGELRLDALNLAHNPVTRVYEAPLQLKAAGGVLVVDDFGRQAQSPQELINRLIIPLEKGVDYLSLETGRKFEAPFDSLVVFSTNIAPRQLVDAAALRRLRYKILVDKPDQDMFLRIFVQTARAMGVALDEATLAFVLVELYGKSGAEFQAFHPRFLIDQVRAMAAYRGVAPTLSEAALRRAWRNLFTAD